MHIAKEAFIGTLLHSIDHARQFDVPYRHWSLAGCLPTETIAPLLSLPMRAPALGGVSGKRELHNDQRTYFDVANRAVFPICAAFCEAFQDPRTVQRIADRFGAQLDGTHLRIEYAQDLDGFWLEPHTDLGVKAFTMLLYLSGDPLHAELGTDIYDSDKKHVDRFPFTGNTAMVFVPSSTTYHGFERRPIRGVRKTIVVNYVTDEWRAREQLAFPDAAVGRAANHDFPTRALEPRRVRKSGLSRRRPRHPSFDPSG